MAGVVADEVLERTKGVRPFVPLAERLEIVAAIGIVDRVHAETSADKVDAWQRRAASTGSSRATTGGAPRRVVALEARLGARRRRGRLLPLHDAHVQHQLRRALGERAEAAGAILAAR